MTAAAAVEDPLWIPVFLNDADAFAKAKPRRPSPRNQEIFHEVRVHKRSQREVARQFELSHGRILQIVRQVERWLAKTDGDRTGTRRDRLIVDEFVHEARLHAMFQSAQAGWQKSHEDIRRSKLVKIDGKPDRAESSLTTRAPDSRLLLAALKVQESFLKFARDRADRPGAEPEEMTREERVAELHAMAEAKPKEMTKDQGEMTKEEEGPAIANSQQPITNSQLPPVAAVEQVCNLPDEEVAVPEVAESVPLTSRLETCSTAAANPNESEVSPSRRKFGTSPFDMYVGRIRRPKPPPPPVERTFYYDGEFIPPKELPPRPPLRREADG